MVIPEWEALCRSIEEENKNTIKEWDKKLERLERIVKLKAETAQIESETERIKASAQSLESNSVSRAVEHITTENDKSEFEISEASDKEKKQNPLPKKKSFHSSTPVPVSEETEQEAEIVDNDLVSDVDFDIS